MNTTGIYSFDQNVGMVCAKVMYLNAHGYNWN